MRGTTCCGGVVLEEVDNISLVSLWPHISFVDQEPKKWYLLDL